MDFWSELIPEAAKRFRLSARKTRRSRGSIAAISIAAISGAAFAVVFIDVETPGFARAEQPVSPAQDPALTVNRFVDVRLNRVMPDRLPNGQKGGHRVVSFLMLSSYHLEPFSDYYLKNALAELGRLHIPGILYATLGETDRFLSSKGSVQTQASLNAKVFGLAKATDAKIWLQLRLYDNVLKVGTAPAANYTADQILSDPKVERAFDEAMTSAVTQYTTAFPQACKIIVFEEAGIYHSADGGGRFWGAPGLKAPAQSDIFDRMFVDRMSRLFLHVAARVKSIDPDCAIGMHLGHAVFQNEAMLRDALKLCLQTAGVPNFFFYDFYLKAQSSYESYASNLTTRVHLIQSLGIPVYHLAQLHTMNNFQKGLGRTPSIEDLEKIIALDTELGVDGFGFYTKNAAPTKNTAEKPFSPNAKGQSTVFESSKDRWEYGLDRLDDIAGQAISDPISLTIKADGRRLAQQAIWLWSPISRAWHFEGLVDPKANDQYFVLRGLSASQFVKRDGLMSIKLASAPSDAGLIAEHLSIGQLTDGFRSDAEIAGDTNVLGSVDIKPKP